MPTKISLTNRDRAINALRGLTKNAAYDDMMYRLYVLQKIEKAEDDITAGRTHSNSFVKRRLSKWLK